MSRTAAGTLRWPRWGATVLLAFLASCELAMHAPPPLPAVAAPPRVIRLRVIAASDSPFDQGVKLAVRDAVLRTLDPGLAQVVSFTRARAFVAGHLPQLRQVVGAVLRQEGTGYGDQVAFTRTWFPPKAYGSWVLPAGRYRALLVVLGAGQGHNWWCVLFPSLCFIDMNNGLAVPPTPRPPVNGHVSVSWRPPAAAGSPPPTWLRQVLAWL